MPQTTPRADPLLPARSPLLLAGDADDLLAELVPAARRRRAVLPLCATCRSVLDAPRPRRATGRDERWCRACRTWHAPPPAVAPPPALALVPALDPDRQEP